MGSGSSSGTPSLLCVCYNNVFSLPTGRCATCVDAIQNPHSKNVRGNVSAILEFQMPEGHPKEKYTVMIDCGKTFRETLLRTWPKLGIRFMDALLLSHPHMDAMLGLDDLREIRQQCLRASPHVTNYTPLPVYLTQDTLDRVREVFPYFFPDPNATAEPRTFVSDLRFIVIEPWKPFELKDSGGIVVTPIPLEHSGPLWRKKILLSGSCLGFEFGVVIPNSASDPESEAGSRTPANPSNTSETPDPASGDPNSSSSNNPSSPSSHPNPPSAAVTTPATTATPPSSLVQRAAYALPPLPSLPAYQGDRILWLSDVRSLSAEALAFLMARPITHLYLDCLSLRPHPTHFNLRQALACTLLLLPKITRLVGMSHSLEHHTINERIRYWVRSNKALWREDWSSVWGEGSPSLSSSLDSNGENAVADDALGLDELEEALLVPSEELDVALAYDGEPFQVRLGAQYHSLSDVENEVTAIRARVWELLRLSGQDEGEREIDIKEDLLPEHADPYVLSRLIAQGKVVKGVFSSPSATATPATGTVTTSDADSGAVPAGSRETEADPVQPKGESAGTPEGPRVPAVSPIPNDQRWSQPRHRGHHQTISVAFPPSSPHVTHISELTQPSSRGAANGAAAGASGTPGWTGHVGSASRTGAPGDASTECRECGDDTEDLELDEVGADAGSGEVAAGHGIQEGEATEEQEVRKGNSQSGVEAEGTGAHEGNAGRFAGLRGRGFRGRGICRGGFRHRHHLSGTSVRGGGNVSYPVSVSSPSLYEHHPRGPYSKGEARLDPDAPSLHPFADLFCVDSKQRQLPWRVDFLREVGHPVFAQRWMKHRPVPSTNPPLPELPPAPPAPVQRRAVSRRLSIDLGGVSGGTG